MAVSNRNEIKVVKRIHKLLLPANN